MRGRFVFTALVLLTLIAGFILGCATGGQPHMQAALDHLHSARNELEAATADKGGHRVQAISRIDEAITEVQAGIDYAAR